MNGLPLWLSADIVREIGWTLVHFLWQGAIPALMLYAILPIIRSAVARHNLALAALIAMAVAPIVTFLTLHRAGAPAAMLAEPEAAAVVSQFAVTMSATVTRGYPGIEWLVAVWITGVGILTLRLAGGWWLAEGLRRETLPLPSALVARCHALQQQIALLRPVRFLQSQRVTAPVVIGWLRPVVLLPLTVATGLPPQQLDALILHELAHIRRFDAFANFFAMVVETALFYHPAVWWVSSRIRAERENICDDLAAEACGDTMIYVEALTSHESRRAAHAFALAATDGCLKARVARLLGYSTIPRRFSFGAVAAAALLWLIAVGMSVAPSVAQGPATPFAIRVVDETSRNPNTDEVPTAFPKGPRVMRLERGGIESRQLADVHRAAMNGEVVIAFALTDEGRDQFSAMTRGNIGHRLAVVIDGVVVSAPRVRSEIGGGKGYIEGGFTEATADALVAKLKSTIRSDSLERNRLVYELPEMKFDKNDEQGRRTLTFQIALELNTENDRAQVDAALPTIVDTISAYLRDRPYSEFQGRPAMERLWSELRVRVKTVAMPTQVKDVSLKQFTIMASNR